MRMSAREEDGQKGGMASGVDDKELDGAVKGFDK